LIDKQNDKNDDEDAAEEGQGEGEVRYRAICGQIYVHSKLAIFDDRTVIVGSANINDRSLKGDRDSEVNLLFGLDSKGTGAIETRMDGKAWQALGMAHSLRMQLYADHLTNNLDVEDRSLIKERFADPVSPEVHYLWLGVARENLEIHKSVFPYMPSDAITTLEELNRKKMEETHALQRQEASSDEALRALMGIRGHLFAMPLGFLDKETLSPLSTEGIVVPQKTFM